MVMTTVVRVDQTYVPNHRVDVLRASALRLVEQLLDLRDVDDSHRRHMLTIALWKWTEATGVAPHPKYNIRFCSAGVLQASSPEPINHEHVYPRQWLIDRLLSRSWTREELADFLDVHGVACVVTVSEHAALSAAAGTGWMRYVNAGVPVYDRAHGGFVVLDGDSSAPQPPADVPATVLPGERAVDLAVVEHASTELAQLLAGLATAARRTGGVTYLHQSTTQSLKYFRIYDTQVEEPTRTVAYVNFSGAVHYALEPRDVPERLIGHDSIRFRAESSKPYLVECKIGVDKDLAVAEELLEVALVKLREEYEAAD